MHVWPNYPDSPFFWCEKCHEQISSDSPVYLCKRCFTNALLIVYELAEHQFRPATPVNWGAMLHPRGYSVLVDDGGGTK